MGANTVVVILAGITILLVFLILRGKLLHASTRAFIREIGFRRMSDLLHAYAYVHWTEKYIRTAIHRLLPRSTERERKDWSDHYHAKVLTPDHAKAIITLNKSISLRDLEQVIPYPTARDLVLNGPPDVTVFECVCRAARKAPCLPTQVCLIIGQPFADLILDHHPRTSRRLTQAEALTVLREEHERGHVHTAWFKDVMLNRFYAICNCCPCCCGGMEGMLRYGMSNIVSSGFVSSVDDALCDGCGACESACPFKAVSVREVSNVDWNRCMGCGICETKCPRGAVSLRRDEKKGLPLDVRMMN